MNLGLDLDGTITSAPEEFKKMVQIFREAGHKVYIVTMRYTSESYQAMEEWLGLVDGFFCTGRQAKKPFMDNAGLEIHIWIDDNPQAVHMSAVDIWGWASAEGDVMTPKHDEANDTKPKNLEEALDQLYQSPPLGQAPVKET